MENTLYEKMGGTYTQQGDYLLPDMKLPKQREYHIGAWGNCRRRFLKEHHRVKYYNLLTACQLLPHLEETEQRATNLYNSLVEEMARRDGLTEKLKAERPMVWVGKMNAICEAAREIVNTEIIFA